MWPKEYKDYPPDSPLRKERVETMQGITGCEMNEANGWGESFHQVTEKRKRGLVYTLLNALFGSREER